MPKTIKYYRKKRNYRKRRVYAKKAIKTMIKRELTKEQETKWWGVSRTTYSVGNVGVPLLDNVTQIPQGDNDTSRDGDKCRLKRLELRYCLESTALSANPAFFRVMIVQWREHSSVSIPTAANILQSTGASIAAIISPYNHDQRHRFKVMYDKVHKIGASVQVAGNYNVNDDVISKVVRRDLSIPARALQFSGGGTDSKNHIYIFAFGIGKNSNNQDVAITYQTRALFTDS